MKGRVIAVCDKETADIRAALFVDGRLQDVTPAPGSVTGASPGETWIAKVTRKLPKSGAFCELTSGEEGYLRDAASVKEGACIAVQVVSLPEPGKAVTLTTRLLFKGPRLILTPNAPGVNVSRRIGNEAERARLTEIATTGLAAAMERYPLLQNAGLIIRTAARDEIAVYLERELRELARQANIALNFRTFEAAPPVPSGALGPFGDPLTCDWLCPLPDEILVGKGTAGVLRQASGDGGPERLWGDDRLAARLREVSDPMADASVAEALDELGRPGIPLDGGASMFVEPTRALVAVDVNTGSDFSPAAGLKANLAAARELPRQLRLRGLGGQIAVDFAPMPKQHRRTLEEALKKAFRADSVETALIGWTKAGLFELQRKRERQPLSFGGGA